LYVSPRPRLVSKLLRNKNNTGCSRQDPTTILLPTDPKAGGIEKTNTKVRRWRRKALLYKIALLKGEGEDPGDRAGRKPCAPFSGSSPAEVLPSGGRVKTTKLPRNETLASSTFH